MRCSFLFKGQVHALKSQIGETQSLEEEMSPSGNAVKAMSVDEESGGFWINGKLEGHSVKMQIETASFVSFKTYKKKSLKHLQLRPSDTVFRVYTRHPVCMKGMRDVLLHCNDQSETLAAYITKKNFTTIMGRLVQENLSSLAGGNKTINLLHTTAVNILKT